MKVTILGCGPAGLLAAHAVEQAGQKVEIFSRLVKSEIPGSLHLRASIPGLTSPYADNHVTIVRMGTAADYARKVYGDSDRYTGWDNYHQIYPSWNAVWAYDTLWEKYAPYIQEAEISASFMKGLVFNPFTISTLPHRPLCIDERHHFYGQPYWIKPLPLPPEEEGRELIVYNGMPEDHWYRYSVLGDKCSIETTMEPDGEDWIGGIKPTDNDCNCWSYVHRFGRWAKWQHGVLLHHVYEDTKKLMEAI